ncbi:Choline transport protein [Elsinoe australis]|uniref:Choline transport protein n=1 Tax=Elsinoe australis TaxID=40998 RepID=A0A2P8AI25_9PEZI|nr:Choline transport protein [Elsinoe australis]
MDVKEMHGETRPTSSDDGIINASGHKQELERNFGLLSIIGLVLTSANTWLAVGGTLTVAIYNGGAVGVITEYITVSLIYFCIAASLAELASAMPSAGGVYHWATITAGKWGRPVGFFAGWLNSLAWIFGLASSLQILGLQITSMYALYHPEYVPERSHVLAVYLICCWMLCAAVIVGNRILPHVETLGGVLCMAGFFVSVLVCAIMPGSTGGGHATATAVWKTWSNGTGWSDGLAFCLGMLNGAYAVGTPDAISKMCEEVPHPSVNIPKAMLVQYAVGFVTGITFLIAIFYGITDFDAVIARGLNFPLAAIYEQATGSTAGAVGLIVVAFLPSFIAIIGLYLICSRAFWTLARDNATPFPSTFGHVSSRFKTPANSVILCASICTLLALIYLGNSTAFAALIGSFVILTTISYLLAILPHLLRKRQSVESGPFFMKGAVGYAVNIVSCLFIVVFDVLFCFPFAVPFDATTMNYASLLAGGLTVLVAGFWFWRQKGYDGPKYVPVSADNLDKDAV